MSCGTMPSDYEGRSMQSDRTTGVRLDDLRFTSCRYPLGGPWERVEFFCGKPTKPGCSWCDEHRRRVFSRLVAQPPKSQSDAKGAP
jgi:hypothetical protein